MNNVLAIFGLLVVAWLVGMLVLGAWRLGGRTVRLQDDVHELAERARKSPRP
jgi:hypothetical protein